MATALRMVASITLALHALVQRGTIKGLGSQMGVGKESDVYLVTVAPETVGIDTPGQEDKAVQAVLKIHRLGRTSFRSVSNNRSYHGRRSHASWQYLSRLSAQKEFTAMRALHTAEFPVPTPIGWNRHMVVMSLVPGIPFKDVHISEFGSETNNEEKSAKEERIGKLYDELIEMTLRLAERGVIHGDFNEFNILVESIKDSDSERKQRQQFKAWLIDLPQITSTSHPNAQFFFTRDINCIISFFQRKYHFQSDKAAPTFVDAQQRLNKSEKLRQSEKSDRFKRLDITI